MTSTLTGPILALWCANDVFEEAEKVRAARAVGRGRPDHGVVELYWEVALPKSR